MSNTNWKEGPRQRFIEHIFNTYKNWAESPYSLGIYKPFFDAKCFDDLPGFLKQKILTRINYEMEKDPEYWPISVRYPGTTITRHVEETYTICIVEGSLVGVEAWRDKIFDEYPPHSYNYGTKIIEKLGNGRIRMTISYKTNCNSYNKQL